MDDMLRLLKAQLIIDEPSQDELLRHYLLSAISSIEKYSGVAIIEKEKSDTFLVDRKGHDGCVKLDDTPNTAPIVTCDGTHIQSAVFSGSKIYLPCSYIGRFVTVHYKIGIGCYSQLPHDLKQAVMMTAAYMFSHRGDEAPKFFGNGINDPVKNSGAYELLFPYKRVAY